MKTKREMLKYVAKHGSCEGIKCFDCPYYENYKHCLNDSVSLKRIGAKAILRMFRKKKESTLKVGTKIKFKNGVIYTIESCIEQYQEKYILRNNKTKVCYPIDYLIGKIWEIVE